MHHHTTGVLGALELSKPGEGGILPHEHTTPKAKSDRLQLLQATGVQLSPIWGLSPARGLAELLDLGRPPDRQLARRRRHHPLALGRRRSGSPARDRGLGGERADRDRRRPPPLRDLARVPRRTAGGARARRLRPRDDLRRRAGRRRADRAADPPPALGPARRIRPTRPPSSRSSRPHRSTRSAPASWRGWNRSVPSRW